MNARASRSPGSTDGSSPCCSSSIRCTPPPGKCSFTCSIEPGLQLVERGPVQGCLRPGLAGLPRPSGELRVGRLLADAGQRPARGLRAAGRDARGDQRVQRRQVRGPEESLRHLGEAARDLVLFRVEQRDAVHLHDPGGGKASAVAGAGGDHEPLDLGKPPRAEVFQPVEVFCHPGVPRRAVLARDDQQVQFSRLDHRVVAVAQQHQPRHRARRETLRRLSIDHPLDAVCRRRLHGRLLN